MSGVWTCLIRIKAKEGTRSHLIEKPSFTLGRTQDADLPIVDSSVSRVHSRVAIKDEVVWLTDEKSANGTYLNGRRLDTGESVVVESDDVVTLGTLAAEFRFLATPKPYEMLDSEAKNGDLMKSMEEVAQQIEQRSKLQAEEEIQRARREVEQLLAAARRDADVLRTKDLLEIQDRKRVLEGELTQLKLQAQTFASSEKNKARREADLLISEAQKKIQADYEECNNRIQALLQSNQAACLKAVEDAEARATAVTNEAREEAGRIRNEASEEARQIQQNATKRSGETLAQLQDQIQREVTGKKEMLLERVAIEAERERERLNHEHQTLKELHKAQLRTSEEQLMLLKTELDELEKLRGKSENEVAVLKTEAAEARKLMASVEDLVARRTAAEHEMKEFIASRADGLARVQVEIKDLRERLMVDYEKQKEAQASELMKSRLKTTQETQALIGLEEKRFNEAKRLRVVELSESLHDGILPKMKGWIQNPEGAEQALKSAVREVVERTMLGENSSINLAAVAVPTQEEKTNRKKWIRRTQIAGGVALLALAIIYGPTFTGYLESHPQDGGAGKIMEARRIQSLYNPAQTPEYRDNYTDNVLYMTGYLEAKTDPSATEKWTLKLNNIEFLRPLGLSEEDIVQFVSKETNLIQRLKALRGSIDAVYLDEGLSRLRSAEAEDLVELKKAVKGEEHYKVLRKMEREFITAYIKKSM